LDTALRSLVAHVVAVVSWFPWLAAIVVFGSVLGPILLVLLVHRKDR
jgi:hypothetical protein